MLHNAEIRRALRTLIPEYSVLCTLLLASLGAVGCTRSPEPASTTITIGTVLPLSGNYAEYGRNVVASLELGIDEASTLAKAKIRIVAEDDQADPAKAVSALQKLIQVDGAKFIIGGFTSGSSIAMYPVAERSGVLMFSPSSSTPALTLNTPLFFRNWPSDARQAAQFAKETLERFGKHSTNILYSNSEYGVNAKRLFGQAYAQAGGTVPVEEAYEPNSSDFRPQIRKFLATPADSVWLFGYYAELGNFLKQARELGLRTQFFGQEGIEGDQLIKIAGPAAEGLIYFVPAFDPNGSDEAVKRFVAAYKAKTGRAPEVFAAHAFDALHILATGIGESGPNPAAVAKYLPTVRDYRGVAGMTSIDQNGDAVKALMVKTIKGGQFVAY